MNYSKIIKYKYEIIIILIAIAIRIIMIWQPIIEVTSTRQVMTASVARNFFYHGYNIFYPQLDFNGSGPSLYAVEFPIFQFLVAILYFVTNSVNEIYGRLLNIAFFIGALFPLYQLVRKYTNINTARWSILLFSFSPLSILYSRAFIPETMMICLFLYSLWLFDRWLDDEKFYIYAILMLITATAVIVRPYALIMLFPMFYLAWYKYKSRLFLRLPLLIFPFVIILPSLLWYYSMWSMSRGMVGVPDLWSSHIWDLSILTKQIYYKNMWNSISGTALTPLCLPFVILGLLFKEDNEKAYFFHAWFLGVMVFFITIAEPNAFHDYYQFSLIPVASVFFGKAIDKLQPTISRGSFWELPIGKIFMIVFAVIVILFYIRPIFGSSHSNIVTIGKSVQELTSSNDLVVAAQSTGPAFLYYCDRKGWAFMIQRSKLVQTYIDQGAALDELILDPIKILESYRKEGAAFFVAADMKEFNGEPAFESYMRARYNIVRETPTYIIFDIKETTTKGIRKVS